MARSFLAPDRGTTLNFQVWMIRDAVLERGMSLIDHIWMKRCNFLHDHYRFVRSTCKRVSRSSRSNTMIQSTSK